MTTKSEILKAIRRKCLDCSVWPNGGGSPLPSAGV